MAVSPFQGFPSWVGLPTAEAVGYRCFVPDGTLRLAALDRSSFHLLVAAFLVPVFNDLVFACFLVVRQGGTRGPTVRRRPAGAALGFALSVVAPRSAVQATRQGCIRFYPFGCGARRCRPPASRPVRVATILAHGFSRGKRFKQRRALARAIQTTAKHRSRRTQFRVSPKRLSILP